MSESKLINYNLKIINCVLDMSNSFFEEEEFI